MNAPIQLIVGLGNPGAEYQATRHNAGAWFIETLVKAEHLTLRQENKFKGSYGKLAIADQDIHLLIPNTFMNHSGQSVGALANFYKIPPEAILIVHDDLDLEPGTIRLKFDGGHGGHNGLRDIMAHLNTAKFYRLRIGIGHPGQASAVINYVLTKSSQQEKSLIDNAIKHTLSHLPDMVAGSMQKVMKNLHTK